MQQNTQVNKAHRKYCGLSFAYVHGQTTNNYTEGKFQIIRISGLTAVSAHAYPS